MKGIFKNCTVYSIILLILSIAAVQTVKAEYKPRWVTQGVKGLNKQRSNTSYEFVALNSHDLDINWLKDNNLVPLKDYIKERFHAIGPSIEIYPTSTGQNTVYKVIYKGEDGRDYVVDAKLVDEFQYFDDYELNEFQYEYYQLYAVSMPNTVPQFDNFHLTNTYTGISTSLSLIPGAAQLYKGQTTKAYLILGGEAAFLGLGLLFDSKRHEAHRNYINGIDSPSSWRSKDRAWRNFELGAFSCAGVLYIYNVIDGIVSKGARQVQVKKVKRRQYSYNLMPYFGSEHSGMSFMVNF